MQERLPLEKRFFGGSLSYINMEEKFKIQGFPGRRVRIPDAKNVIKDSIFGENPGFKSDLGSKHCFSKEICYNR